ncbi:MAG: endonuclease/exonuclease/phosphatase family protein [Actinomycetota bacterium]|nr:endonuclease/exonuclease/phosphatase family protein [Actinomycetota bacterium]
MRLVSFNVLNGRSLADGRVSTPRLAAACASLDADVLALQEVDRHQTRSGDVDQTEAVAEATGAVAWRFEPALIGEPGATWRAAVDGDLVDGGPDIEAGYGVALVSRLAVRSWHVVRLRAARVRAPVAVPGGRGRFILLPDEPRVALVAVVDAPFGALAVATTHLSFVPGWNAAQLRRVARSVAPLAPAAVLLGDLNLPPPVPRLATGWRELARVRTFPAANPSMQIDHALGHGALPPVTAAEARELPLSDHRALVVDLAEPAAGVNG